jgi:syntaxin 1B/2/3
MQSYNGAQSGGYADGSGRGDANDVLNQCQAIDKAVEDLESQLLDLQGLHSRVLNDRASNTEVDRRNAEIMAAYRNLGDKLKKVKGNRESGSPRNAPQVGRVDRKLKKAINDYQRVESDFRKQMQEQQARQYRIVRPDATDIEVQEAVEEPNAQIFQQAVSIESSSVINMCNANNRTAVKL